MLAVSASAIFVRLVHAPAIAFWRCAGGALLLTPALLRKDSFSSAAQTIVGGVVVLAGPYFLLKGRSAAGES